MTIVEPAPAKINLALHVRARLPDGYHDIETLFAFATDGDRVTVSTAASDAFALTGPFADDLRDDDPAGNLVLRARDAFRSRVAPTPPVAITLDKHLPVASGIGGGSADAAATLRALARIVGVDPRDPRLVAAAAGLGADVPACLAGITAFGSGRGDALSPVAGAAGMPLLLVNPRVAVSTGAVFRAWDGVDRGPVPPGTLLARGQAGRNDLAAPATGIAPVIGDVVAMLTTAEGVVLARMSGSGATCFGLFADVADRDCAAAVAAARGWWVMTTTLA